MDQRLAIKLQYNDDIRRVQLDNATFSQLKKMVHEVYPRLASCILKYKDEEGDFITISCDSELTEAFNCSTPPLRVTVIGVDKPASETPIATPSPVEEVPEPIKVSVSIHVQDQPQAASQQPQLNLDSLLGPLLSSFCAPQPSQQSQQQQPQQSAQSLMQLLALLPQVQNALQQNDMGALFGLLPQLLPLIQNNPQLLSMGLSMLSSMAKPGPQGAASGQDNPLLSLLSAFGNRPQQSQEQVPSQPQPDIFGSVLSMLGNMQMPQPASSQPLQEAPVAVQQPLDVSSSLSDSFTDLSVSTPVPTEATVSIQVPEPTPVPTPATEPQPVQNTTVVAPQPEQKQYEQEVDTLEAMGFADRQLNRTLLQRNDGDLSAVVEYLTSTATDFYLP